jgi:hypothetical protein
MVCLISELNYVLYKKIKIKKTLLINQRKIRKIKKKIHQNIQHKYLLILLREMKLNL